MGGTSSKKTFTEWDLIQFSSVTGVPLPTVEKIYEEFIAATGSHNKMDNKEFRRLYKEMFMSSQTGDNAAPFLTDHELNKMSDHVFDTYDYDGSGKLTFEEFAEVYLMLNHYAGTSANGVTRRDRFNYILDQYDSTPNFVTRDRGEEVFNRLNNYKKLASWNAPATADSSKPVATDWEQHWSKLDDGTGRVPKEKFVDYITNSNDYKRHFDPAVL